MRSFGYKFIVVLPVLLLSMPLYAQWQRQWATHYNGTSGGQDFGRDLEIDTLGFTYCVGSSAGSGTGMDAVLVKFDSLGKIVWSKRYSGPDSLDDWTYALVLDDSLNIYIAGETQTAGQGKDYLLVKYNNSGQQIWVRTYDGPGNSNDAAVDLGIDGKNNLYITGTSNGDYLTLKYNRAGDLLWQRRYNGSGNDLDDARTIAVTDDGTVCVSGGSTGDTSGLDFVTVKYNTHGDTLWINRYNGPGNAYDLVYYQGSVISDKNSNVYVCGYSTGADSLYEYTVVKYDVNGIQKWVYRKGGAGMSHDDYTDAITIDPWGNIYLTGAMYDSNENYNIVTVKLDSTGGEQWSASWNGASNDWDEGYGVIADDSGHVYVLGRSNKKNFAGADFVLIRYDSSGKYDWDLTYSRGGFSWPFKLRTDQYGNMYAVGWSSTTSPVRSDLTLVRFGNGQLVGIGIISSELPVRIYPNPAREVIHVRYSSVVSGGVITLSDLRGEMIKTIPFTGSEYDLTVEGIAQGVYLLSVNGGGISFNKKVVVRR